MLRLMMIMMEGIMVVVVEGLGLVGLQEKLWGRRIWWSVWMGMSWWVTAGRDEEG